MQNKIKLKTARCVIRLLTVEDINLVISYYKTNRDHLIMSTPSLSEESFYTREFWVSRIQNSIESFSLDKDCSLFIFLKDESEIIGTINYSNICRGPFQACYLGYGIAQKYQGRGLMNEALKESLNFIFSVHNLHRVMANYVPSNKRSGDLLKLLGFLEEGVVKDYLFLNGKWQDHVLTSLISSVWKHEKIMIM